MAETVGRRVRLIRAGTVHKGLCPFHQEKTPSFTVDERRGTFHCFGCGAHGNAIDFVMRTENLGFREVVERLAQEVGLALPEETPEARARDDRRTTLQDVLQAAAEWFADRLADRRAGSVAWEYLAGRGLDEAAIRRFGIGYAPAGRNHLKEALGQRYPENLLVEAGLLGRPEDGGASYDRFRSRVIFPIRDPRGRIVGFGGRVLGDGEPKYLNSPETEIFQKGRLLYGHDLAAAALRGPRGGAPRDIVAVEGYMDVIALHLAGIETAVAPLGTALTEQQIALLWRLVPEPILCFDGDTAGQRAAARAAERALPMLKPGHSLRFAMLPAGEDPDSLVRNRGPAAIREILAAARPLRDVLLEGEIAGQPFDTPERRAGLRQRLRAMAGRIEDRETQQEYQEEFARTCDDAFGRGRQNRDRGGWTPRSSSGRPAQGGAGGWPAGNWGGAGRRSGRPFMPGLPEQAPPPVPDHWGVHESRLLLLALRDGPQLAEIAEGLGGMAFRNPALEAFRRDLVDALTLERLDSGTIERHLTDLGHGPTLERLRGSEARRGWACVGSESSPEEALFHWRHSQIAWQLDEIERETAQAERNFSELEPVDPSMRLVRLAAERAELLRYREELDGELDALRQSDSGRL